MSNKGKTIDLETQKRIVSEYREGVRGCGALALSKKFHVSKSSVQRIVKRKKRGRSVSPAPRGHKIRKLSHREEKRICAHLDKHPSATNEQLAKVVREKIKPRTVSDVLARASPPFSRKKFTDQEPEEFTDEWKQAGRTFVRKVKRIAQDRRIYGDESGIYTNDAPKTGRARVGKRLKRKRKRHGKNTHFTLL